MLSLIPLLVGALGLISVALCARLLRDASRADLAASAGIIILPAFAVLREAGVVSGTPAQLAVGCLVVGLTVMSLARDDNPVAVTSIGLYALLLGVVMVSINVAEVADISATRAFARFAPALLWLVLALRVSKPRAPNLIASASLALAFGIACILTATSADPWRDCTQFKCGPFGSLLAGPFASENFFAQMAAVTFLISVGLRRSHSALATSGMLSTAIVLYASSSRTSQIALAVALFAWFAWSRRSIRLLSPKSLAATLLPFGAVLLSIVLVYRATPTDFSNRGYIWILGRTALGDRWWSGVGIDSWSSTVLQRNFMHSQALLLLYSAGVGGVLLYALAVRAVLRSLPDADSGLGFAVIVLALVLGLTEIVWNPVALDGSAYMATALLLAGQLRGALEIAPSGSPSSVRRDA